MIDILLDDALDILSKFKLSIISISFPIQSNRFRPTYKMCIEQTINATCTLAYLQHTQYEIDFTFAKHNEFNITNIEEFWNEIKFSNPLQWSL
jgi:uncharacterized phage-like protein YoqJ